MTIKTLNRPNGEFISYEIVEGKNPLTLIYLHGLNSSKKSYKAGVVREFAEKKGVSYLSLDYSGHGESWGTKEDFRIGRCLNDAMEVIGTELGDRPIVVLGSSMGSWVEFLLAERLKDQIKGIIGVASGVDFLSEIWEKHIPDEAKEYLKKGGALTPEQTGGYIFNYAMFEDAKQYQLIEKGIDYVGPVALLQGDQDKLVHVSKVFKIKDALASNDVVVHILKGMGHSMHEPLAREMMEFELGRMIEKAELKNT